jgi:hypothetical protein
MDFRALWRQLRISPYGKKIMAFFNFRSRKEDPLADPRAVEQWMQSETARDPVTLLNHAGALLSADAKPDAGLDALHLAALIYLDEECQPSLDLLCRQYLLNQNVPRRQETTMWYAQYDAAESFLVAYERFFAPARRGATSQAFDEYLPIAVVRAMKHQLAQAKLRLFRHERPIPAKWQRLHGLYELALQHRIERQPVRPLSRRQPDGERTVEREYVKNLALLQLSSGNLGCSEIEYAARCLDRFSDVLHLDHTPPDVPAFEVDLGSSAGFCRHAPHEFAKDRCLYWDPAPLLQSLAQALEGSTAASPAGETPVRPPDEVRLLRKLMHAWSPDDLCPRPDRSDGKSQAIRVLSDLFIIADAIESEDDPEDDGPSRFYDYAGATPSGIVTRGVIRCTRPGYRPPERDPGAPWRLFDRSDIGFRFSGHIDEAGMSAVGALMAVKIPNEAWILTVVRRAVKISAEQAEYGVELFGTAPEAVVVRAVKRSGQNEDSLEFGQPAAGLRFQPLKHDRGVGDHALLVAPENYRAGTLRALETGSAQTLIRYGAVLARGPGWTWAAYEDLGAVPRKPMIQRPQTQHYTPL